MIVFYISLFNILSNHRNLLTLEIKFLLWDKAYTELYKDGTVLKGNKGGKKVCTYFAE